MIIIIIKNAKWENKKLCLTLATSFSITPTSWTLTGYLCSSMLQEVSGVVSCCLSFDWLRVIFITPAARGGDRVVPHSERSRCRSQTGESALTSPIFPEKAWMEFHVSVDQIDKEFCYLNLWTTTCPAIVKMCS